MYCKELKKSKNSNNVYKESILKNILKNIETLEAQFQIIDLQSSVDFYFSIPI